MQPVLTPAIILKRIACGESDQIVTFFSRYHGRQSGIAKGAKNSRRRFGGALEPGSIVELTYRPRRGSDLVWLGEARVLLSAAGYTTSLVRIAAVSAALELALGFLKDGQMAVEKFDLLAGHLSRLALVDPVLAELARFSFAWLSLSGFAPVLDRCTTCAEPADQRTGWRFTVADAGLVCPTCRTPRPEIPLSLPAGDFLPALRGVRVIADGSWQALRAIGVHYTEHILGRPLKSAVFKGGGEG